MKFPRIEVNLKHPRERVTKAFVENELEPYFKKSGRLTVGSAARGIRWHAEPDGNLVGKVSYFRSANLSIFRFRVQLESSEAGTRAVILVQNGPFSPFFRFLLYAIGLCVFVVGLVFSFLADKVMQRGLLRTVQYLEQHLKMWDEAV